MARATLVGSLFTAAIHAARIVEALIEHFILGASILSAAEPLCGTATQLDYMVEVLTAANVMNATGENSEGIEGVSEMLEGLQKYSKPNPQGVVALPVNS